jgi:putative ABC transport system permease protein
VKRINIFRLSIKNLQRKFIRTALLLLAVAVVTGTLFGSTIFITGMQNALHLGTYRLGADVLVVPEAYEAQARSALLAGEPTSFFMDRSVYDEILKIDGVKSASPQLFIKPSSFTCCYSVEVFLVAFDPKTDFTITPWLEDNIKNNLGSNDAIAGRSMPVIAGSTLPFFGTPFKVVGTMEPTGMKFFDQSIFMTMDAAYKMAEASTTKSLQPISIPRDRISAVLVQVDDTITPDRVAIRIGHDVEGVRAIASDEVISTVRRQLSGLMKGILVISSILWVLALLMIGFAFYMIVNERQREIGLLRAMGAKKRSVFSLIVIEAVVVSFAGGVIGLGIGSGFLYGIRDIMVETMKLPYLLPSPRVMQELVAGALIFSIITGLISSLIPAAIASRMEPYDAIRKGE